MLPFLSSKSNCTGCGACYAACPTDCITMNMDEEGFLYPTIDSNECINCGKCKKVCPQCNSEKIEPYEQSAFAGCTRDNKIWERSTSGGAFSEICLAFGDENTLFVGAAWDELSVKHIAVIGTDKIQPLCKSKYIASDTKNTFKEIKQHLEKGYKAVFCGTPCQVAGLRAFLRKEYDNLLLIDFICHGVGSPRVFQSCINALEDQFGKVVDSYEFRSKRHRHETDYMVKVVFENTTKPQYIVKDQYMQLFLSQNCLRPSCGENCVYRNENRVSDITIADFKGMAKIFPELLATGKNYSSIVVNSEKGSLLAKKLERTMEMHCCPLEYIKKYNPLFCRQTWFSVDRDKFFEEYTDNPDNAIKTWTVDAKKHKKNITKRIYDLLPKKVKLIIIKAIHR